MRRFIAVAFMSLYALTFTECHQALKLPLLFKHYQEHSSAVDMTFLDYLVMHYETDIAHDNDETDNDTDRSLPFKTCDHPAAASSVALVTQKISLKDPAEVAAVAQHSFYQQISPSLLSHDIFQPPKA